MHDDVCWMMHSAMPPFSWKWHWFVLVGGWGCSKAQWSSFYMQCYQAHISILFKEVNGLSLYSQTKALPVIWIGETWTPPGGEIFVSDGKKLNICMCNSKNTWYQYTVFSLVKRLGQCLDHTIHISLFLIDKGRISKRMYILASTGIL